METKTNDSEFFVRFNSKGGYKKRFVSPFRQVTGNVR